MFRLLSLLLTIGAGAVPQDPPILKHGFEETDSGWMAFGGKGNVTLTRDAANVREGKSALKFIYTIEKNEMGVLLLPAPERPFAKAKSLRFWVKADWNAPIVAVLQEKDGGRYTAMFSAPANAWQKVKLAPSDFVLSDDAGEPADANGKLDMDQVEAVGLADLGQMFAQGGPDLQKLLGVKTGDHTLIVDELTVSAEPLDAPPAVEGESRLDAMLRPQAGWIATGGVGLASATGAPLNGPALQARYNHAPTAIVGFSRRFSPGLLKGTKRILLKAASVRPVTIIVQLEEKGGGKYNAMATVPGNREVAELSLDYAQMSQADDSKDANNKLDLDQVRQITILDITGFAGAPEGENTLWVGPVRAAAK